MKKSSVLIYSTSWCGPCRFAKQLLEDRGFTYTEVDIEEKGWSRDDLFDITGGSTVPQIIIDDEVIGGYDDLLKLDQEGKL